MFARLNDATQKLLATRGVLRRFEPREILWHAGDEPRGLYLVIEGNIQIVRGDETRQHVVHTAGAGATIGEVPLFDGGPYPATAIAQTKTTCLFLDRDTIVLGIREDPTLALELLSGLSRRVRHLVDQLHRTTLWTVRSRLASHLVSLTESRSNGMPVVRLDKSQADLAEYLGTVREVLARELATLRRYGVVRSIGPRAMEVQDMKTLQRLAAGDDVLTHASGR